MSRPDDYPVEMIDQPLLTDADVEALMGGTAPPRADLGAVAGAISELALMADAAPPVPTRALAAVLAGGPVPSDGDLEEAGSAYIGTAPTGGQDRRRRLRLVGRVATMSLAAKLVMASGAAAAGLTGAAAADALPGPVQNAVADLVGAVTPFEFPHHGSGGPASGRPAGTPAGHDAVPGRGTGTEGSTPTQPSGDRAAGEREAPTSGPTPGGPTDSPGGAAGGTRAPDGSTARPDPADPLTPDTGSPQTPTTPTPTTVPDAAGGETDGPTQAPDAPTTPNPEAGTDAPSGTAPTPSQDPPSSAPEPAAAPPTDLTPDSGATRTPRG